jgi:hypothetical protein
MTQMTAMTTPPCGIDPFDPHLNHGYDCHTLNKDTNPETPHTISLTSLDMPWKASKNVNRGQFVIHGDAHTQIHWQSNRLTTTSIPIEQAIAKPDFDVTSHADALSIPVRPKTPTRPSKHDEAQKHEKTETLYQSANFVTVDNNPSPLKSQNNFLSRKGPIFGERRKMHHAYLVAASSKFPPTIPNFGRSFFHFPQFNFHPDKNASHTTRTTNPSRLIQAV